MSTHLDLLAKMKAFVRYFLFITAVVRGVEQTGQGSENYSGEDIIIQPADIVTTSQIRPFSSSGDSSAGFIYSGGSSSGSIDDSSVSSASGDLHPDVVSAGEGSGNYSGGNIIVQPAEDIVTTSEPTAAPTSKSKSSLSTPG